ncbi:hypothetical protein LCGC14_2807370 [marine sediment metagenome]|uniref:UVR domain-containing protein n=1 Tax=marine sediment metagenome TaxID=412755 RepID=A0A0F8Z7Q9_9ZZZZ
MQEEKKESMKDSLHKKLVIAVKKGDFQSAARLRESIKNIK